MYVRAGGTFAPNFSVRKNLTFMCSACSGDYEDPEMSSPDADPEGDDAENETVETQ